jgi:hypothetical protein
MPRPQAVGLRAVMLSLVVLSLLPMAANAGRPTGRGLVVTPRRQATTDAFELARTAKEAVQAGTTDEACTGWRSSLFPPPTVRILRTNSPLEGVNGTVETVDFRTYVGIVIAAEWPSFYPPELLKAGALAVKQFAWYYAIVYRGGVNAEGECYDMQDDTIDQYYQPEVRVPLASQLRAIDATWTMHLRKSERTTTGRGRFILTGYRSGPDVDCGADKDSWRIYQHSAYKCARAGMNMEQILRTYLEPRLEIVTPGRHDIFGSAAGTAASEVGDASAVVEGPGGELVPHVWQVGAASIELAEATGIALDREGLLGFSSEDANGDGWDDLVVARKTGASSVKLSVARSDGTGYINEVRWWSGDVPGDAAHARLLTGDFNGDGRADAALLLRGTDGAHTLVAFLRKKGSAFQAPVTWWTGTFDPETTEVFAGDVNGDGRSDLIAILDLGAGGRDYQVAYSPATGPGLSALRSRYVATDLVGNVVKHVVGDVTRDGRDDVVMLVDGADRSRIEVLRPLPAASRRFQRAVAWTSPSAADDLPLGRVRLSTSDVDYDGLMDLVVYRDKGEFGTQILTFRTRAKDPYQTLTPGLSVDDASVDWASIRPY